MSRIDRMFVCSEVFNKWPNACVRALHREMSDHSPLVLSLVDTNFGHKPFRWFDSWLEFPDCIEIIKLILVEDGFQGSADVRFCSKLKRLRMKLKDGSHKLRKKEDADMIVIKAERERNTSPLWRQGS